MFDYIVVGGGSAGSVLASRLSQDPAVKVCLLEAGPADRSVLIHCPAGLALMAQSGHANWGFQTVPQAGLNGRRGYQPRGKVLGGSSSINAMIYLRGQAQDYDRWAALGTRGWGWSDVLPYFLKAEHNERGADDFHATGGPLNVMDLRSPNRWGAAFVQAAAEAGVPHNPDFNGAAQEGAGPYQVTHRNGERYSVAKAYLTPHVGQRPNLQIMTDVQVLRLSFDDAADPLRATGVELRQDGSTQKLMAKREVLLCAGALQSPQLLMLSGIGEPAALRAHGIPVRHALPGVGQRLQDHVDVVQVVDAPQLKDLFGLSLSGAWQALRGIRDWRRDRTGLLTTNFAEAGAFIKSGPDLETPDLQLHFVIGKLVDHGRKTVFGHGYSCHVCLLRPKSRGQVTLASADPLAAPLIDPGFFSDPDDLPRLVSGFKAMRHILSQPALASHGGRELQKSATATSDAQIEHFIRNHADTIYHPVGTCSMGPASADGDAAGSVVDATLRVHGVRGLRVVDASVMPSIVSGNTNAPTVMIAEKAAAMILAAVRVASQSATQPTLAPPQSGQGVGLFDPLPTGRPARPQLQPHPPVTADAEAETVTLKAPLGAWPA
ncbi:MAG: GMC family oxidoreductase N-terminal domain-containing protein [Rubrivivax sp.]